MNFDKEAKSDKKKIGERKGGTETKTVCQTMSNEVIQKNYLHNVAHVVQSTFQNTVITF